MPTRRSRLTFRLDGAVEVTLVEVAPTHHRSHVAGIRIDRNQRRLQRRRLISRIRPGFSFRRKRCATGFD